MMHITGNLPMALGLAALLASALTWGAAPATPADKAAAAAEAQARQEYLATEIPTAILAGVDKLLQFKHDIEEESDKTDSKSHKAKYDKLKKDRDLFVKEFDLTVDKETKRYDSEQDRLQKVTEKLQERIDKAAEKKGKDEAAEKELAAKEARIDQLSRLQEGIKDIVAGAKDADGKSGPLAMLGHQRPDFSVPLAGGGDFTAGNKPVVVTFWSSYNATSVRVLDTIQALAAQFRGKEVDFIAINLGDDEKTLADAAKRRPGVKIGINDKANKGKDPASAWHVGLLPVTFLANKDGDVVLAQAGLGGSLRGDVQRLLTDDLSEKPAKGEKNDKKAP